MLEKVFLLALAVIVVADASTFKESLMKNVNRYKQNNFEWNIRNLNADNFVSLRKIENRKDREFKAYLQQLKSLNDGHALDSKKAMQYITEEKRHEDDSPFKLKLSSLDVRTNGQQPKTLEPNRKDLHEPQDLHVMMYSGKKIAPQSMCYACESNDQKQATATSNDRNERYIMSMKYYDSIAQSQALLANNENNTLLQQLLNLTLYGSGQQPQDMLYNSRPSRDRHEVQPMMYNNPQAILYSDKKPSREIYSKIRRSRDQHHIQFMIYPHQEPHHMIMYSDKRTPQDMMYSGKKTPQEMMYNIQQSRDVPERRFIYDDLIDIFPATHEPRTDGPGPLWTEWDGNINKQKRSFQRMLYSDKITPQEMIDNAADDSPEQMLYSNTRESNDNTPLSVQVMMYNKAAEDSPQQMLYSNYRESNDNTPLSGHVMMYNAVEDSPQQMLYSNTRESKISAPRAMQFAPDSELRQMSVMMYDDDSEKNPKDPNAMMYNAVEEDSPQQMLYSNARESKISAPRAMQFVPDNDLDQLSVMMYDGVEKVPKDPNAMMYSAVEEDSPQQMLYSNTPESNDNAPRSMQVMFYDGPIYEQVPLQPMMYDGEPLPQDLNVDKTLDDSPQSMLYSNARDVKSKRGYKKTPPKNKSQENSDNRKHFMLAPNDRRAWYNRIVSLAKTVPMDEDSYFNKWTDTIALFGTNETARAEFKNQCPVLSLEEVLLEIASIKHLENLFWPFVFENGFMNQKLGLLGLSGVTTTRQDQKLAFYEALERHQTIHIPATADKIVLSFNDESVLEGLNRSGLMETQKQYANAGLHLFTPDEQEMISRKVNSALHLINSTMPQLYDSISQVIGCIAYYKAQIPGFAGGSVSSSLGMIWQDPRAYREQSVAHYAEQIVHEFIHNSLFLADMVHGTFVDSQRVSQAKVYSPIRHELRDFDKTFHASYVSTGVALFHAKAGNLEKARKLLEPLEASVAGLVEINDQVGVLNESGNAMLQSMVDFLTVIRLV